MCSNSVINQNLKNFLEISDSLKSDARVKVRNFLTGLTFARSKQLIGTSMNENKPVNAERKKCLSLGMNQNQ